MKNQLRLPIIISCLLIISVVTNAQLTNYIAPINSNIKKIELSFSYCKGWDSFECSFDTNFTCYHVHNVEDTMEFDQLGFLRIANNYDASSSFSYNLDNDGRIVKIIQIKTEKEPIYTSDAHLETELGNQSSQENTPDTNEFMVEYDSDFYKIDYGESIKNFTLNHIEMIGDYQNLTYNSLELIESIYYNNDTISYTDNYLYDKNQNLIQITRNFDHQSNSKLDSDVSVYEYIYDEHQNWTKQTYSPFMNNLTNAGQNNWPAFIKERKITYY